MIARQQWRIRKATLEDAVDLQSCVSSAFAPYQVRLGEKRLPPMDVDYSSEIKKYPTWVAECNGNVVGGLIMTFEQGHASLSNIAVHPEFQGQGLGRGLMEFAESQAKEKQYSELRLATHVLLTENVSLYRHLGWTEIDRDEVRVYMRKAI